MHAAVENRMNRLDLYGATDEHKNSRLIGPANTRPFLDDTQTKLLHSIFHILHSKFPPFLVGVTWPSNQAHIINNLEGRIWGDFSFFSKLPIATRPTDSCLHSNHIIEAILSLSVRRCMYLIPLGRTHPCHVCECKRTNIHLVFSQPELFDNS